MASVGGNNAEQIGTGCPGGIMLGATATEKVGFYGASPVAQQATAATATDATTSYALANALKLALDNLGITA